MKQLFALLLAATSVVTSAAEAPRETSVVISDVVIIDGTGAPARNGALRIAGDRIVAVGDVVADKNEIVIDGGGKVLAPGFIDTHSHYDSDFEKSPDMAAVTSQGVTTIIVGQDGSSPSPLQAFFAKLARSPIAVNVGSYSGHNTLREQGMNAARRPATDEEIARMGQLLEDDMAAGALGLSTGLEYETGNFSTSAEVIALAKVSASLGGRYISHIRDEEINLMSALQEVIDIGKATAAPVQISHLKIGARKLWGTSDKVLKLLDDARTNGIDITADVYPYTYWQSTMRVMFPNKVYDDRDDLARTLKESTPADKLRFARYAPDPTIVGKTLFEVAKERGGNAVDVYLDLMKKVIAYEQTHHNEENVESVIGESMREEDVVRFMKWEHANICSDGSPTGHPRGHGTFPRVLGRYVRDNKVMSLEQAVYKMTGLAARHVGIIERGTLAPGYIADLVLFDPNTMMDRATLQNPTALSVGIDQVWVNGKLVFQDRKSTGVRPGVVVRPSKKSE